MAELIPVELLVHCPLGGKEALASLLHPFDSILTQGIPSLVLSRKLTF